MPKKAFIKGLLGEKFLQSMRPFQLHLQVLKRQRAWIEQKKKYEDGWRNCRPAVRRQQRFEGHNEVYVCPDETARQESPTASDPKAHNGKITELCL